MEAATVPAPTIEAPTAEAERPAGHMFQWYAWVHVGPGAEDCEHACDGKCQLESEGTPVEERHFHAWCRLPNQFQIRDIAEKARAAKARKMRAMRDPEADPYAILENELEDLDQDGAVEEVLNRDWLEDYTAAVREVDSRDTYEHIDQDREEFDRQMALPEEDRDEGFADLGRHLDTYQSEVDKELENIQAPKRTGLKGLSREEVVARVRRGRIENVGNDEYLHTYNYWSWFVGTMKPKDGGPSPERRFRDIQILKHQTAPEVIDALKLTFDGLENRLARGRAAKNS